MLLEYVHSQFNDIRQLLEKNEKELCTQIEKQCQDMTTNFKTILDDVIRTEIIETIGYLEQPIINGSLFETLNVEIEIPNLDEEYEKPNKDIKDLREKVHKEVESMIDWLVSRFENVEIRNDQEALKLLAGNQKFVPSIVLEDFDIILREDGYLNFSRRGEEIINNASLLMLRSFFSQIFYQKELINTNLPIQKDGTQNKLPEKYKVFIDFTGCKEVNDSGLEGFSEALRIFLPHIERIAISFESCTLITTAGIKPFLEALQISGNNLVSLNINLKEVNCINDDIITALKKACDTGLCNLTRLVLNFKAQDHITDQGMMILSKILCEKEPYIKDLILGFQFYNCNDLTDIGINSLSKVVSLYFSRMDESYFQFIDCNQITDEGAKTLIEAFCLERKDLHALIIEFKNCPLITDNILLEPGERLRAIHPYAILGNYL